jgi:hypothetical protein
MLASAQSESLLHCHPDTPCPAVASIKATISWKQGRALKIVYTLNGAVDRLRVPPRRSARRTDGLWQHTCFELFIAAQNDAEYYEFNFSPSGEWAAYEFRNYRDGGAIDSDDLEPNIAVQQSAETLELSAVLRADRLSGIAPEIRLSLGLSAVIEGLDESLSYWALKHSLGKPDFHHPDSFAFELTVPGEKS